MHSLRTQAVAIVIAHIYNQTYLRVLTLAVRKQQITHTHWMNSLDEDIRRDILNF